MGKRAKTAKPKRQKRRRAGTRSQNAADRYFTDEVLLAMGKVGVDPAFAYAFKKTGLMPPMKGSEKHWPKSRLREWNEAVEEFEDMEAKRKAVDAPDPREWSTEIPAMMFSGFDKKDYAKVRALIRAIESVEKAGPITLRARWEFAAAVLATALSSAYSAGMAGASPRAGPEAVQELFDTTISVVVKRAREIYGQGGA